MTTAEKFLNNGKNAILTIVKAEEDYNLYTHADFEKISALIENEVLFIPFSAFGVNNFIYNQQKNRYEIQLINFGKYTSDKKIKVITNK